MLICRWLSYCVEMNVRGESGLRNLRCGWQQSAALFCASHGYPGTGHRSVIGRDVLVPGRDRPAIVSLLQRPGPVRGINVTSRARVERPLITPVPILV